MNILKEKLQNEIENKNIKEKELNNTKIEINKLTDNYNKIK